MEFKPFEESTAKEPVAEEPVRSSAASIEATHSESVELKIVRPESYQDVGGVADNLLAGCTVVLNVELLDKPSIIRMLDFLNGVTYCTDGEIKKVAATTFIITPHSNVDVSDL